jgi:hypothetical protein
MVSHTYHIHLESSTIELPNIDDLLGKDVEVVIREINPGNPPSNFDEIDQLLTSRASSDFFKEIEDPSDWQKQIRDEWE